MKTYLALSAALAVALSSAQAQFNVLDSAYTPVSTYTHGNSDSIVSFDFGANGALYYQTATSSFNFGGFYQYASGVATAVVPGSSALFSGASVVSIGQSIYFNNSDFNNNQFIYQYKPSVGLVQTTVATNYGLTANQGRLFISGTPASGVNHIYYSGVNAVSGNLDPAVDLGEDSGGSGPLAFDAKGNLFYAPGYGDQNIYRWSKADVDAAIANPTAHPLGTAGHQFADFAAQYGGTSMAVDANGNLLLTLTSFTSPSVLDRFGVNPDGTWDHVASTLLSDTGLLGELRVEGNTVLLSSGNQIYQLVPEPSTGLWLAMGLLLVGFWRQRSAA